MLHSISKPQNARSRYYLSPGRFRLLLERMRDGCYRCADPKKLEDPDAVWSPRELVLTFDDGYDDFYTEVFPLIAEHGLKPFLFLPADWIGRFNGWEAYKPRHKRNLMTLEQIRELQRYGVCFGSHSLTHPSLPTLNPDRLWREVSESKNRLEDLSPIVTKKSKLVAPIATASSAAFLNTSISIFCLGRSIAPFGEKTQRELHTLVVSK